MGDKKIMKLELDSKNVKIKELLKGQFLELVADCISDANPNRNGSHFTLEAMEDGISTFANKPVLGAFNEKIGPDGDFMGHEDNGLNYDENLDELYYDYNQKDGSIVEVALGVIRESDPVEIIIDKKTGLHWIRTRCALWTAYNYKAIKSLLKSRNGKCKVSVEVEILDSYYDEAGIEHITKFNLLGFTLLGSRENGQQIQEGIEGAHLTVLDFFENEMFAKKAKALHYAYSALENYNNGKIVETSQGGSDSSASVEDSNNINLNNSNTCEFSSDSDDDINEAPEEEITMENQSQEGGNNEMLTMNEKCQLLDNWLKANRAAENSWIWVCDMTDTEVFYNLCNENDEDLYYRAPYSITEDEEGHPVATVDIENEVRVVKKWADFADDNCADFEETPCSCEKCEESKCENSEEEPDDSDDKPNDDSDDSNDSDDGNDSDNKEDMASEEKCEEAKCEDEKCEESKCEDEKCEEAKCDEAEKCEESKFEESKCEMEEKSEMAEGDNSPAALNNEPDAPAGEGLSTEEGLEAATASICAPDVQADAENTGDAAENMKVEISAETPAEETIVAEPEGTDSEEVSQGPDDEKAEVIDPEPIETKVEQPNDEDKEKLYSAETVNVNGTDVDINTLYSKYSEVVTEYEELNKKFEEMKTNYDALQNEIKVNGATKLAEFGKDFVNAEEDVDVDSKADFSKQIEDKCMSYELSDEDAVTKFAKSLIAMYLYEKRSSHKNNNSIVMPINVTPNINSSNVSSRDEVFDNAFNKLKNI